MLHLVRDMAVSDRPWHHAGGRKFQRGTDDTERAVTGRRGRPPASGLFDEIAIRIYRDGLNTIGTADNDLNAILARNHGRTAKGHGALKKKKTGEKNPAYLPQGRDPAVKHLHAVTCAAPSGAAQ